MRPERNVGGADRILRTVLGVWLVVVGVAALTAGKRATGVATLVAGVGLLNNALTGYCGLNNLLGVDTSPGAACSAASD